MSRQRWAAGRGTRMPQGGFAKRRSARTPAAPDARAAPTVRLGVPHGHSSMRVLARRETLPRQRWRDRFRRLAAGSPIPERTRHAYHRDWRASEVVDEEAAFSPTRAHLPSESVPTSQDCAEQLRSRRRAPTVVKRQRGERKSRSPSPAFARFALLGVATTIALFMISVPDQTLLNYALTPLWSMYFPVMVVGLLGAAHLRSENTRLRRGNYSRYMPRSFFHGRTNRMLVVTVPSLVCAGNLPALKRVITSLLVELPKYFERFRVDLIAEADGDVAPLVDWLDEIHANPTCGLLDLTSVAEPDEEGSADRADDGVLPGTRVRILVVPSTYSTPRAARFKTRANHYAMQVRRLQGENDDGTYVYHLDDDTHIGEDTSASLAEFIERRGEKYLLAQGVLAFPRELTPSLFCWLADAIRPADDLGRFAFFTGALGTPLAGLHGEHLIIRADIEDEIGWDYPDTVIEDAYFAVEFSRRYPGRSCTLNSYSYGASPCSVRDLVRQRRRWIEGLLRLITNRHLPLKSKLPLAYSVVCWASAPFQFVGFALLVSYLTGIDNTSPIASWVIPFWSLSLAYVFWQYLEGCKVNLAASAPRTRRWIYPVIIIPFIYILTPVETLGILLGFVRFLGFGRQRVSEVITKPI